MCDAVLCNSEAAADRLAAAGLPRDRLAVIGNALPAASFQAVAPALPRRPVVLRVGMVARMNAHYKNHAEFLRIAAEIHQRMPETEFLLVGDGPLRPELERKAASLPVVAYNVGGNAELINEQRGALVAAGDEHEFAIAILRLLSDASLRGRQGRTSRQFTEENFGVDRVRRQYEDLYTRLVRQKG